VGRADAGLVLVGRLEVDVVAAGGEAAEPLPGGADPLAVSLAVRIAGIPRAERAEGEAGVAVANRSVVGRALVEAAGEVKDAELRVRYGTAGGELAPGGEKLVAERGG